MHFQNELYKLSIVYVTNWSFMPFVSCCTILAVFSEKLHYADKPYFNTHGYIIHNMNSFETESFQCCCYGWRKSKGKLYNTKNQRQLFYARYKGKK